MNARQYLHSAHAAATTRAYRGDWTHFSTWCRVQDLTPLPVDPETLIHYLAAHAGHYRPATLSRKLAAISHAHELTGHPNPAGDRRLQWILQGIRRHHGTAPAAKAPLLAEDLRRMVEELPGTTAGLRDRAVLLVGFAGCFRRSELAALRIEDLSRRPEGLVITIPRSKTDQEGAGSIKGIPYASDPAYCPIRALERWVRAAGIRSGYIFRRVSKANRPQSQRITAQTVALIVKNAATRTGLDPARYAGHSLRSGLATQAAINGASERSIQRQGNWTSAASARHYVRDASLFRDNAASAALQPRT